MFQSLLLLEEQEGSVNFKFGVLYAKAGQYSDDEMFSNGKSILSGWKLSPVVFYHSLAAQNTTWLKFQPNIIVTFAGEWITMRVWLISERGSREFERFLTILGNKIRLKGWDKYRGGLDVKGETTVSLSSELIT